MRTLLKFCQQSLALWLSALICLKKTLLEGKNQAFFMPFNLPPVHPSLLLPLEETSPLTRCQTLHSIATFLDFVCIILTLYINVSAGQKLSVMFAERETPSCGTLRETSFRCFHYRVETCECGLKCVFSWLLFVGVEVDMMTWAAQGGWSPGSFPYWPFHVEMKT